MHPSPNPERLFTTKEAALFLGLSPNSLNVMRCRGTGPSFLRLGGRRAVRYAQSDLDAFASDRRTSTSDPGKGKGARDDA